VGGLIYIEIINDRSKNFADCCLLLADNFNITENAVRMFLAHFLKVGIAG